MRAERRVGQTYEALLRLKTSYDVREVGWPLLPLECEEVDVEGLKASCGPSLSFHWLSSNQIQPHLQLFILREHFCLATGAQRGASLGGVSSLLTIYKWLVAQKIEFVEKASWRRVQVAAQ